MNCAGCGKKLGMFTKKHQVGVEYVCDDCLRGAGYSPEDLKDRRFQYTSWNRLSKGKAEIIKQIEREEYERTHTREIKRNLGDIDPKIEKTVIKTAKDLIDSEDLYGGWTIASLKREDNEYKHTMFGGIDFDCELKEEGDKVAVYFEDIKVAETSDIPEIKKYDYSSYLIINGGKYRQVEDGENVSGEDQTWLMLKIVYVE